MNRQKFTGILIRLIEEISRRKTLFLAIASIVVFTTTYILILPAFTLDADRAAEQGGIDVPEVAEEAAQDADAADAVSETALNGSDASDKKGDDAAGKSGADSDSDSGESAVKNAAESADALIYEGEGYSIEIADKSSVLPEGTELTVEQIDRDNKEQKEDYDRYYKQALEAIRGQDGTDKRTEIGFARIYDISLSSGGSEIEPDRPVDVTISYDKELQHDLAVDDESNLRIVHITEDEQTHELKGEVLDLETVDVTLKKDKVTETTFEADSFSVYAVVYTVDFHYEVNGEKYDYSISGGGYVNLTDLIEKLGVSEDAKTFVDDIEKAEFSDPALVWVGKTNETTTVGNLKIANDLDCQYSDELTEEEIDEINAQTIEAGDWALIALKPFTSEEILTITMKNGDQIIVQVTDAQYDVHIRISDKKAGSFTSKYFGVDGSGNGKSGTEGDFKSKNQDNLTLNYGFTANPADGYRFAFWVKDDGTILSTLSNTTPVTRETTFTGYFVPKDQYVIVYRTEGNGTISRTYDFSNNTAGATASPNYGYVFDGWYDQNGKLVSANASFTPRIAAYDMVVTAKFRQYGRVNYNVGSNNASWGDVTVDSGRTSYIGRQQSDDSGYLNKTITATPKEGYVFSHWELDGLRLDISEPTISAHDSRLSLFQNSTLTAVFSKSTEIDPGSGSSGVVISDEEKQKLNDWLDSVTKVNKEPLKNVSKTSQVYDYEKRIYEVDFNAESAISDFYPTIDLGFILDASGSMKFPSKLTSTGKTVAMTKSELDKAFPNGGTYYIVSDPTGTSTVYQIWRAYDSNSKQNKWYYADASKYDDLDNNKAEITGKDTFKEVGTVNTPLSYLVYTDGDSPNKRLGYLNSSLQLTMQSLRDLVSAKQSGLNSNSEIYVAYNSFAYTTKNAGSRSGNSHNNLEFSDFQKVTADTVLSVKVGQTAGGTRQDLGLKDAANNFSWSRTGGSNAQKYAILISDGASVNSNNSPDVTYSNKTYSGNGTDITWIRNNVTTQADALKAKGVTLITVGLSTKNVVGGSDKLYEIADSIDGQKQFYEAESGEDLKYILMKILQTIMARAEVEGQAQDVVDPAFYPVDSDGNPIQAGYYYDADGDGVPEHHANVPANSKAVYYEWINNNGNWTIKWYNQTFGSEEDGTAWKPTFYVKSKEDFLGGNTITTNSSATIIPESYKFEENGGSDVHKLSGYEETIDSPIVNVKELSLNGHDATWTLYVGSEVTDDEIKTQIGKLFDAIDVSEIVTEDGKPVVSEDDKPVTFALEDLIRGPLTSGELDELLAGKPVTRDYDHYGHDDIGTVTITLTKVTNEDGDTVYTLVATYESKDPVTKDKDGADIDWHNGPKGPGDPMTPITSNNTQTISDYYLPQDFQVKKIDENDDAILTSPAMFKLYRKAKGDEEGVSLATYDAELNYSKGYYLIDTVHTDGSGIARIGSLKDALRNEKDVSLLLNAADGPYYLVETGAPMGYTRIKKPTTITVTAGPDTYTDLDGNPITVEEGKVPEVPYNVNQGVTITVSSPEGVATQTITVDKDGNKKELTDDDGAARSYLYKSDSNMTYQTSIRNESIKDEGGVEQTTGIGQKKQIDYLGDRTANPDTTVGDAPLSTENSNAINDLYRLYLDMTLHKYVENTNIVLVADYSSSMNTEKLGSDSRYEALRKTLTGSNGFVNTVLSAGSGNEMTFIKFSDKAHTEVLKDWTGSASDMLGAIDKSYSETAESGIDFEYAIDLVESQLARISASRADYPTYVIVLSDGIPTVYLNKTNDEVGGYESITNPPAGVTRAMITGQEVVENLNIVLPNSIDAISDFRKNHTDINICTIGIGSQMDDALEPRKAYDSGETFQYAGQKYNFILEYLGRNGYQTTANSDGLKSALNGVLQVSAYSDLLIYDELSEYVSLYTNQPDFAVTKTSADGSTTDMTMTYDAAAKNYKVSNGSTEIGRLIIDGKKISLDFADDLYYDHGDTYTLSFNVQATTKAYEDYAANLKSGDSVGPDDGDGLGASDRTGGNSG